MIEAIILKLCFTMDEFEQFNQQHYSNYVVYAVMDDNEDLSEVESCWYVRVEKWQKGIFYDKYSSV